MTAVRRLAAAFLAAVGLVLTLAVSGGSQAHAAVLTPGQRILNWATSNASGHWYAWGGSGFAVYDCSGVIYRAALQTGVSGIPRTTYEMLASAKLVRTYRPVAGSIAFFGPGHVEIVAPGHDRTFGALSTGTRVGYHTWYPGSGWEPTAFYNIVS